MVFFGLNALFVLFVRFRVPETANKSLDDIQKEFQQRAAVKNGNVVPEENNTGKGV